MKLKVRAAFRRRPDACRAAQALLPCIAMESQAQSWVKKSWHKSVHPRFALALLCCASQVCSKAPDGIAVAAKEGRERRWPAIEASAIARSISVGH